MKKLSTLLIAVLVAAGLLRMCVYTVNEREYALVFALGELKTVISEPGLHVKLPPPLQNIVYLDKRILNLDAAGADLVQTSEKKNLLIDTFVKWRIEDPRLYWVSFQAPNPLPRTASPHFCATCSTWSSTSAPSTRSRPPSVTRPWSKSRSSFRNACATSASASLTCA